MLKHQWFYLLLIIVLLNLPNNTIADTKDTITMSCDPVKLMFATPIETFKSYLNAILCNDFESAKKCWTISDDNKSGALDVISGLWVTCHKLNKIISNKFSVQAKELIVTDCTDEAIYLTLNRLANSTFSIDGDMATIVMKWEKGDGYPNYAFFYRNEIHFKKTNNGWKLDANESIDSKDPSTFLKPGGLGVAMLYQMKAYNNVIEMVEKGDLVTYSQFRNQLEKEFSVVKAQWLKEHQCPEEK